MKKTIIFLYLFMLSIFVQAQWTCLNPSEFDNFYVSIADDSVGFFIGSDLYRSQDRGNTWERKPLGGYDTSIQFLNADNGFVTGSQGLRRTTDRGETWEVVLDLATDCVRFANDSVGYASGDNGIRGIYKTTDGGKTWHLLPQTEGHQAKHLVCINENTVYAFGFYHRDIKSYDGGKTWVEMEEDLKLIIFTSYFFNAREGFVVGSSYGSGYLFHTTDSCKTFELVYSRPEALGELVFIDQGRGILTGGRMPNEDNPLLLITNDGGNTWHNKNPVCNT